MRPRFRRVDRDQWFLLPPDVRDWLPSGHPALFVVEVVEELDLSRFEEGYRSSVDRGRPAYHPTLMVGILLYAAMTSVQSSRRIERLLATDVGFRVVASNERPDHGTICRFLVRHKEAMEGLFAQVVGMAAEAGVLDVSVVALDGTKMPGDASPGRNESLGELRRRFSGWAEKVEVNDAAEDAAEAEAGDSGPVEEMFERDSMRQWIRRRLDQRDGDDDDRQMNVTDPDSGLLPRSGGGWVQGYNAQAAAVTGGLVVAADVTSSPADMNMLASMVTKISDAVTAATDRTPDVVVADAGYWDTDTIEAIDADPALADVLVATGRKQPDKPPEPLPEPGTSDDDHAHREFKDSVEELHTRRVAVIARLVNGELLLREAAQQLGLSITRVCRMRQAWINAGGPEGIRLQRQRGRPPRPRGPSRAARRRHAMEVRLAKPTGRSIYRQRQAIIEPVFGDVKTNRRITRFLRRGHDKVKTEWHWILTGHNLTILHRHTE